MSETRKYKVTRRHVKLDGKDCPVGSIVELTEQQATVGLVNKVELYVEPVEVEESIDSDMDGDDNPEGDEDLLDEGEEE